MEKQVSKPLHETPAQRLRRVCGSPLAQSDKSRPFVLGLGVLLLVLAVVAAGVLVASAASDLIFAYCKHIWDSIPR